MHAGLSALLRPIADRHRQKFEFNLFHLYLMFKIHLLFCGHTFFLITTKCNKLQQDAFPHLYL